MKKRIINAINNSEKTEIPDIVNEKCNTAYETIRLEAQTSAPMKHIRHKKKAAIISVAAAAAIACSGTVAAAYFRSAYNFISKETYTKNPEKKMDLSPFAEPVNNENKQTAADITMQSVYCDGENLSIAFMLIPNNEDLKRMTHIGANITAKLNDQNINLTRNWNEINFIADNDGTFYGTVSFQNLEIADDAKLEIRISSLRGRNTKLQTWKPDNPGDYYGPGGYEDEMMDTLSDKFDFETTVKADTSNNRLYEIGETQDGITLENVLITPFKTTVSINGLDERQQIRIVDQNGEKLEYLDIYDGEDWEWRFVPPLKTAKQLSVQVFDLDTDNFPTQYEFTFDIEKGFADKYDVEYDDSDVVYDPPREELEKHWEEEYKKQISAKAEAAEKVDKLPVNTPIELDYYIDETLADDEPEMMTISWKITGSEIGDVIDDDVSDGHWEWLNDARGITPDNAKMLFVTYELTNMTDKTGSMYTNGGLLIYSKDFECPLTEPDYISYKDNGGKSSFKYDFEPHQTKTITYGYVISEDYADQEFYAIGMSRDGSWDVTANNISKGRVKLMEIK